MDAGKKQVTSQIEPAHWATGAYTVHFKLQYQ